MYESRCGVANKDAVGPRPSITCHGPFVVLASNSITFTQN